VYVFAEKYDTHHPALESGDNSCNEEGVEEKVFGGDDGCVGRRN
jgi:hypothetical protein